MKKMLSLMLCLALLISCTAALAEVTDPIVTPVGELPVVSEPLTITVGMMNQTNVTTYEYGENYLVTLLEDLTGIHIDWDLYPAVADDAYSKLRLQINGGEKLDDLLIGFDLNNDSVRESYGQAGALIPLNDYIENLSYYHAQNLAKTPEGPEALWAMGRSLDGNYYGMMSLYRTLPNFYSMRAWYNRDFVTVLGMDDPGDLPTQEWFLTYLRGVRDNDVNGNGDPSDEVPLTGGTGWQQNIIKWCLKMYTYIDNTSSWFQIEDGILSHSYEKDEFREGLKFVRQLYDEKLFPDYALTQDNSNYVASVSAPTPYVGIGVSGSCSGFGANMPIMNPIPVVAGPDGFASATYIPQNPNFACCITSDAEHPEAIFRMMDAYNAEQWYSLVNRWGQPDVDWKFAGEDDVSMYESIGMSAYFVQLQSVWGVPTASILGQDSIFGSIDWENTNSRFAWDGNEANNEFKNALAVAKQVDYVPDEYVAKIIYSIDEQEEWANVRTAIDSHVNTFCAQAVTGQIDIYDDAVWANFQAELIGLGSQELLEMDQAAYNRTMGIE